MKVERKRRRMWEVGWRMIYGQPDAMFRLWANSLISVMISVNWLSLHRDFAGESDRSDDEAWRAASPSWCASSFSSVAISDSSWSVQALRRLTV
jgi:hypothetical protein